MADMICFLALWNRIRPIRPICRWTARDRYSDSPDEQLLRLFSWGKTLVGRAFDPTMRLSQLFLAGITVNSVRNTLKPLLADYRDR